jgi:hypothetical protein
VEPFGEGWHLSSARFRGTEMATTFKDFESLVDCCVQPNFAFPSFGANYSLEFHDVPPSHVGTIFTAIVKDGREGTIHQFIAGDPVTDVALAPPKNLTIHM